MNRQKKGEKMRRWEIKVGWSGHLTATYEYYERQSAQRMAFELAERTGEPVTVRFIEEEDQPEVEDDIPVE